MPTLAQSTAHVKVSRGRGCEHLAYGPASRHGAPGLGCKIPEIALILTTYQKPWHLKLVLASIARQEGVKDGLELVVADDGSTDETLEIVERFSQSVDIPVSWTTHPHKIFQASRCRNEGALATRAEYLLFLDGDCVLPPDHVFQHLRHRAGGKVMGGYCYRVDEQTSTCFNDKAIMSHEYLDWVAGRQRLTLAWRDFRSRFYQWIHHPTKPHLRGGNFGIWRSDYERVNGFDENFEGWGCEDDDMNVRLRRAGVQVQSILRWTRTYHLWHPRDVTYPVDRRNFRNRDYCRRRYKLARCMNGMNARRLSDLAVRVAGEPSRPEQAAAFLESHGLKPRIGKPTEVEFLFLPATGYFSGHADCNIVVVLGDVPRATRSFRAAHLVIADRALSGVRKEDWYRIHEFKQALASLG